MRKNQIYYLLQFGGWLFYSILAFLFLRPTQMGSLKLITILFLVFSIGIVTSHTFRYFIIKLEWTKLNISALIPRVLVSIIVVSVAFQGLYMLSFLLFFQNPPPLNIEDNLTNLVNWSTLLMMWSIIYFAYHFFERYRHEEIKNLKWQASKNEIELNKLKSQLNPHFIFNAMNSIRALIDEDPTKAKHSVTQLANILRNTLMMGRKKTVLLEEELAIVRDYVDLEKTRYEERLEFEATVDEAAYNYQVPSLMIQTLVENGIKHGISKLPKGGRVDLKAYVENDHLVIEIENTGELADNDSLKTGFGLINTIQRLNLLYGDNASFKIKNTENHTVLTKVVLPKEPI